VWNTRPYFWVVTCKNQRFHHKENVNYRHHILLGENDSYTSLPRLPVQIEVRCESCGKEFSYAREEVLRAEVDTPEAFIPHPLFTARA
jgi:hypothetical protein